MRTVTKRAMLSAVVSLGIGICWISPREILQKSYRMMTRPRTPLALVPLGVAATLPASQGFRVRNHKTAHHKGPNTATEQEHVHGPNCGEARVAERIEAGDWPEPVAALDHVLSEKGPCTDGQVGGFPCSNVNLLSEFTMDQKLHGPSANDVWGWTDPETQKEYALLCVYEGTVFVDISDPESVVDVGFMPTATRGSIWGDVKVHKNRAYKVSEARGHGLQVFDLTSLRGRKGTEIVAPFHHHTGFGNAHNVVINEETGRLYAVGSQKCRGGLYIMDVNQPEPEYLGCFGEDGYTHDAECVIYKGPDVEHRGKEICVAYNEDTVTIVDVTDGSNPTMISRTGYQGSVYTHQGWFTEDQRTVYMNDELDESRKGVKTTTYTLNVEDLDNPVFLPAYVAATPAIDHNLYVKGDYMYQANYRAGLRILKINEDRTLDEVGFFDVWPESDSASFNGAWSVYPYFPSGTIAVSSIEGGLFVVKSTNVAGKKATTP